MMTSAVLIVSGSEISFSSVALGLTHLTGLMSS